MITLRLTWSSSCTLQVIDLHVEAQAGIVSERIIWGAEMVEYADTAEDNYIHVNERYAVTVVTDSSLLSVVDLAENWVAHLNFIVS